MFAWRAARNILPTKAKLFDKGIIPVFTFEMCNEDPETTLHTLWDCTTFRLVWDQIDLPPSSPVLSHCDWSELLEWSLSKIDNTFLEMFLIMTWQIWSQRNRKWLGEKQWEPGAMIRAGTDLLNLYSVANCPLYPLPHLNAVVWSPPSLPFFKIYVAVCAFEDLSGCGWGFIMRDFLGHCVIASVDRSAKAFGLESQLQAIICALSAGLDQGIAEIQLECSHGLAILVCQGVQMESGTCRDLVLEIKRLASLFCVCKFLLCLNGCNTFAMQLAAYASKISSSKSWLATILPFLINPV